MRVFRVPWAIGLLFGAGLVASLLSSPGQPAAPSGVESRPTRPPRPTRTPRPTSTPAPTKTPEPTEPPGATPTPTATVDPNPTALPYAGCTLFPSDEVPRVIPDYDAGGVRSGVRVSGLAQPLTAVNVRLDLVQHTYVSDLVITLVAPDGSTALLADRVGADTDDFYRTVLTDRATTPIYLAPAPRQGEYLAEVPLETIANAPAAGTWELLVVDVVGGDTGTLQGWTLELCTSSGAPLPPAGPYRLALPLVSLAPR